MLELFDYLTENKWQTSLTLAILLFYLIYRRKFKVYLYDQQQKITDPVKRRTPRGKCPPSFPNGWYCVLNSTDLKPNEAKYLDYCGRDIAIFRTQEGKVYALDAFCLHMGANLGIGGKVKGNCIECPFHGWTFEGSTGNCVVSHNTPISKQVTQFEYRNGVKEAKKCDGSFLEKCYEGSAKLKKYNVREQMGNIFVWFDSREDHQDNIPYEPLKFDLTGLEYRGKTTNYANCHMQEIPENGADLRHFDFVHKRIHDWLTAIQLDWSMLSVRASDPQLFEKMKHKKDYINDFKYKLFRKYINDDNKDYINVISLDNFIEAFGYRIFFFNITAFQVGPGLVYLFMKSAFFEVVLAQSIIALDKMHVKVTHQMFGSWYLPYWVTAKILHVEATQVYNDVKIWNRKIFGSKLTYNLKAEADRNLLEWRNWYYQFYDGCHEFEKKKDALNW